MTQRMVVRALLALSVACSTVAKSAGHFNVTPSQGETYHCGPGCQEAINIGNVRDRVSTGTDFDFDFYATASNVSTTLDAGEILKLETMDPSKLDIKAGTTIYRMQYTTKDINGSIVPSTGFIAFPYTPSIPLPNKPKKSGFRLAAYAHDTVGIYPACAPSNGGALYDINTWKLLVNRGYAVVATDYAGLGNKYTTHKYLHHPTHANDIKYSVVAARKAFGNSFTDEWMSIGRSQGGGAVWKLAESDHVRNDPDYLGTIAIAPATYTIDRVIDNLGSIMSGNFKRNMHLGKRAMQDTGYLTFLTTAAERALPQYKSAILSETMRRRVELSEKNGLCASAMLSLGTALEPQELVDTKVFLKELKVLQEFQNITSVARGDLSPEPVMVIQGTEDTTIQPKTTNQAWQNACDSGSEVHLRLYDLMEYEPVQTAAAPEFLVWMDAVFAGQAMATCPRSCTYATRKSFDSKQLRRAADKVTVIHHLNLKVLPNFWV